MTYLQTRSGRYTILTPSPDEIVLDDIVRALSRIPRFGGHAGPYSVAQHSVLCAAVCYGQGREPSITRAALMHDAAEAYIGDIPTPLKAAIREIEGAEVSSLDFLEAQAWEAISRRFRLPSRLPEYVKEVDARMLVTEARALFTGVPAMLEDVEPYDIKIEPWPAARARREFRAMARRMEIK